ncbi:MAG TPA: hypothetical protein VFC73_05705 [Syntrophomonadaceae bacterium]|nr:hypothetical protein [Syntrophomonadaceae bacterium]
MKEYIFYVLLVFLPISIFMVKILYSNGLPKRNITYIILISLAIIVTFPITLERLGFLWAFMSYAIIIFLIIMYMLNSEDDIGLEANANKIETSKDTTIVNNFEANVLPHIKNIEETNIAYAGMMITDYVDKEEDLVKSGQHLLNNNEEAELIKTLLIDEETIELELLQETTIIDEESPTDINIIVNAEEPMAVLEKVTVEEEETSIELEILENKTKSDLDQKLITYIDAAFQYKAAGNYESATDQFSLVWENSENYDLKYLVTLELVQIYKRKGFYSLAEELLTQFFDEVKDTNTHLALEIEKELKYIMLLKHEISRLGIEEIPFAQLPRWIKVKVEELLN